MSDLISRQDAIDAIADMHCKSDEDGYVWIIRSDAWARIDALPSAQQWIPWSEKKPDKIGDYLITIKMLYDGSFVYDVDVATFDGYWWDTSHDWDEGSGFEVIAWRDMPDPWKGVDNAER